MENIRNRVDIRLVTREKELKKLINKPQFVHRNIFSENLVAVHLRKIKNIFQQTNLSWYVYFRYFKDPYV